jgi:hypothetical protein
MNRILNLKRRIMARIYFEYTKNILVGHPDYFMLGIFIIASFMLVSFQDVLNNIPKNNLPSVFNFLVVAIRDTSWIIQALIAGFFVRVIIAGSIMAYKNIDKWSPVKLIRLKY